MAVLLFLEKNGPFRITKEGQCFLTRSSILLKAMKVLELVKEYGPEKAIIE